MLHRIVVLGSKPATEKVLLDNRIAGLQAMLTAKLVAMQQTTMHHYTKEDIQEKTALKMDFINKASSSLSDLLEPFRISSDKGRLLYNSDGLQIWDVIKQHKERGENLKEIRDAIATMVQTDSQTNDSATDPQQTKSQSTPGDGIDIRFVVDVLKDSFETAMNEKDRTILILEQGRGERIREISDRREEVVNLKTELEVKKINRAREAKQRADLMTELETLPVFGRGKKRKGIWDKIRNIDSEASRAPASASTMNSGETKAN